MALSDSKKVQTMINAVGYDVIAMRQLMQHILAIRTAFQTHNPSVTGTPLEGNVTALNNLINSLNTELSKTGWNVVINSIVPSHEGKALD